MCMWGKSGSDCISNFYEKQYLEINKAITYIRFKIKNKVLFDILYLPMI
jgi:hypothetical protein